MQSLWESFPALHRNVSGYNLKRLVSRAAYSIGRLDLSQGATTICETLAEGTSIVVIERTQLKDHLSDTRLTHLTLTNCA